MKKIITIFLLAVLGVAAYAQERASVGEDSSGHFRALSSVQVPLSRLPLYADISKYNLHEQPEKAKAEEKRSLTLGSLLDMESVSEVEANGQHFIQIPFKQNAEPILASVQDSLALVRDQAVRIKKYYVRMQCESGIYEYVATLVPQFEYDAEYPEYDFLEKPNYSGVTLFSTLKGRLFEVRTYLDGRIIPAKLVSREEIPACGDMALQYVVLYGEGDDDEDGSEDEIVATICVAYNRPLEWRH